MTEGILQQRAKQAQLSKLAAKIAYRGATLGYACGLSPAFSKTCLSNTSDRVDIALRLQIAA